MAALIALAAIGLFGAGVTTGILGVVTVAIRREEKDLTLTSEATGKATRAGRWLNGVGVRAAAGCSGCLRQRAVAGSLVRGDDDGVLTPPPLACLRRRRTEPGWRPAPRPPVASAAAAPTLTGPP
jgi:hypothetical protein